MTTALAKKPAQAVQASGMNWTPEDIALIRATVAAGATDSEFKLLLYQAGQYGLNPLLRQIWCVKYGDKPAQIFAGRDGFLHIAHRSHQFDGMDPSVRVERVPLKISYYDKRSQKTLTFEREWQYVATCKVYHKQMTRPIIAEVWEEEYSSGRDNWKDKPRTMIQKVAECQALRKAFDISGLYDPAEMGAADTTVIEGRYQVVDAEQEPGTAATTPKPSKQGNAKTQEREKLLDHMERLQLSDAHQQALIQKLSPDKQARKMDADELAYLNGRMALIKDFAQAQNIILGKAHAPAGEIKASAPTEDAATTPPPEGEPLDDLFEDGEEQEQEEEDRSAETFAASARREAEERGRVIDFPEE